MRKAKTTADFFTESSNQDQKEWLDELLPRITYQNNSDVVPYICILDTGINSAHPLLTSFIEKTDLFTINEAWGKNDRVGHGTVVADFGVFGNHVLFPVGQEFPGLEVNRAVLNVEEPGVYVQVVHHGVEARDVLHGQ